VSASPESPAARGPIEVRPARPADVEAIWDLLRGLAVYEKLDHLVTGSAEAMRRHLFGDAWPRAECLVAESDGRLGGYALFYGALSSFWVRPVLWLEDLYVIDAWRGRGAGRALMRSLAAIAVERECARVEWEVLDWNAPAIAFYERLGAAASSTDWLRYRLEGDALRAVAAGEEAAGDRG